MKRLMTLTQSLTLAVTGLMTPLLASAHDYTQNGLRIDHPWSRPTPPGVTVGVGYMAISNTGDTDVTLISAATPAAGQVSIHQSRMDAGVMRMEPLPDGLVIPAGTTVELKPHGYHLMLEQLGSQLTEGQRIPLTLGFDGAPSFEVELAVESLDSSAMPMDHSQMNQGQMNQGGMEPSGMDHSGMNGAPMQHQK